MVVVCWPTQIADISLDTEPAWRPRNAVVKRGSVAWLELVGGLLLVTQHKFKL